MAELVVSTAISKAGLLGDMLTKKLTSSISGELKLLLGVTEEVQYIKEELELMTAFLAWAEEVKQESNRVARAWAKQVRELAYEVEDCVDEFTLHLSQPRSTMQSLLSFRKRISLRKRHQIAAKIQFLKSKIVDVSNRRLRYDLKTATPAASSSSLGGAQHDPRLDAMFVEDAQLVGLDEPRDKIVKWLLEEHQQLGVISVFGMGGLGKTTLARKVYENPNLIGGHFQCGAWVTVSQSFNVEQLLRDMIKQLHRNVTKKLDDMNNVPKKMDEMNKQLHRNVTKKMDDMNNVPKKMDEMNKGLLVEELKNHLQKERCLIVFDDLWDIPAWKSLKPALPENGSGSWIIVTTRNEEVANTCCTSHPHPYTYKPGFLSPEKSWELFCKRVFPGPNHDCPPELEELSKDILKKCGGLPLAIVTTAGILASKPKKTGEEWRNLLSRLKLGGSELDTNPSIEGMKQVLNLGYNDLPYNLKHCFLYLSIFPEDYLINSKRLQRMWIAEGFIGEHRGMTKEEVAESYFNELNNRSLILPSAVSANGKVKNFRVHDIILEVIISKSMEMNTVFLREGSHRSTWISGDVVRRLSVYSDPNGSLKNILEGVSLSRVRTSAIFNHGGGSLSVFRLMRMLRVVNLEGYDYSDTHHDFTSLGKLRHLKYLNLRNTPMIVLPKSYRKFRNLEVLDIRDADIIKLPKWIGELQQLRHIHVGRYYSAAVAPKGISRLKSLQTLSDVKVPEAAVAKELGELSELRKLGVWGLTKHNSMDFCASLAKLSCLRSLKILWEWDGDGISLDDDDDVLCSSPPLLLQHLHLRGPLVALPRWVGSLNEMVKLTLWYTTLGNDDIGLQLLQALPNLNHFELWWRSYIGDHLCFGGGFGSLKVLRLEGLDLKSLEFVGGAMINLQSLHIGFCHHLETVLGCEGLINLKEVKVKVEWPSEQQVDMVRRIVEAHPAQPRFVVRSFKW